MFDIAEWVANLFILGLGLMFWAIFMVIVLLTINELYRRYHSEQD